MRYFLFMDESGDHGLATVNMGFPIFLLCGVIIAEDKYYGFRDHMNDIKNEIWGNKTVIFHSRDIRKCEKEFSVLFDLDIKKKLYEGINSLVSSHDYTIIASAIKKVNYINKHGRITDDVYALCLSFIVERAIFFLDDMPGPDKELCIVIEERGKKEDAKLRQHFQKIMAIGTGYVNAKRLQEYKIQIHFRSKKANVNGLQLADLVAYPIARYIIDPKQANPAFDMCCKKIYEKRGQRYGLKVYP